MENRLVRIAFLRAMVFIVMILSLVLLAGCGGSGGSGSLQSSDTVRISVGQSSSVPADPASPGAAGSVDGTVPAAQNIDHAWITVTRIALVPSGSMDISDRRPPDPLGEPSVPDDGAPEPGLVSGDVEPDTQIDLLNLPAGKVATFLNDIPQIPAGTYGKIRLYYRDPIVHFIGATDNASVHPTAHAHIDIHFKGGDLVIPVRTNPAGGVFIHDVTIRFVLGRDGLKITVNPDRILMRPQVFAEVSPVQFGITGVADNVAAGSFDIGTADNRSFHAVYGDTTTWFFKEGSRWVLVDPARGVEALKDTAIVDVLGQIPSGTTIVADDILITFPFVRAGFVVSGTATDGWKADNTFELGLAFDNVVFPKPSRAGALYEGGTDNAIVNGVFVTARGYKDAGPVGGVDAYWITIGP